MEPLSFYHIAIKTPDLDETVQFYRQYCNADVVKRQYVTEEDDTSQVEYIVLSIADKLVYLFEEAPYESAGYLTDVENGFLHFGIVVDDLDSVTENLRTDGIEIIMGPEIFGDLKIAFFTDPAGVRIEILEHQSAP